MVDVVIGMKQLSDKLSRMKQATAVKALRSAAMAATLPTVRKMKAAAPKGRDTHKTYKRRMVGPGFLSRSVIRKTRKDKETNKITVSIGVKREAFYGVTFLDEGTVVTQRRQTIKGKKSRRKIQIKPYKIAGHKWFKRVFENDANNIFQLFKQKLADKIKKAAA